MFQEEGYGMDWSRTRQGYLLTGDCTRHIHLWTPREADWLVSQQTYSAHGSSVEDIQVTLFLGCLLSEQEGECRCNSVSFNVNSNFKKYSY
jgi:hypothetical protein